MEKERSYTTEMNPTVRKNLERMTGKREGDMFPAIIGESIGGNAGRYNNQPCMGANYYFDANTGEIKYFGNWQNVPEQIRENFQKGTFRIALDITQWKQRIVEYLTHKKPISNIAKKNLEETVRAYNENFQEERIK